MISMAVKGLPPTCFDDKYSPLELGRCCMKWLVIFLVSFSFTAYAHVISFIGPCESTAIVLQEFGAEYANVGELTIQFLEQNNIAYAGSEKGLSTVYNTPMGTGALEVISKTEMRAYGWCYFVDNLGTDVFPDEYSLGKTPVKIEWIYGFAHYKKGKWISTCTPAFTIKPKFLCPSFSF